MLKKICNQLNIVSQCRRYGLSLWQCPQFLFLVMGIIIVIVSVISYLVGTHYIEEPEIITLVVLITAAVLFIIAFSVTRSFERIAEASMMKSEFIDIVSHQMRSPLTNLKWAFELLELDETKMAPVKKEEYFNNIKENIGRMIELVDNLLVVSRIEKGTLPVRKKEIYLDDLIKELVLRYKTFSQASNIKMNFYPQENLPKIFVDPTLLKIALENLIDNAIRYTKGGGEIDIYLQKKEKGLYFKIKDAGVGIPKEDQKYIFQKFFRASNILQKQTQGSGLGLYITKSVIQNLGGKIWFESQEGKGTTFYFILPIK